MPIHSALTDAELHVPGYVQESDPGAVGAGIEWFQPSTRRLRRRNSGDTDWLDPVTIAPVSTQTASSYTLVLTDIGSYIRMDDPSGATVYVPDNATAVFPIGTEIRIEQYSTGPVLIEPLASNPVIVSEGSLFSTNGQTAVVTLIKVAEDEWVLYGNRV